MEFESLNGHFPIGITQKCLYSQASIHEETIRNTEITEDSQLQALQSDLGIPENDVILIVAHTPSILLQLEGQLVGQAHYHSWSICRVARSNRTLSISGQEGALCSLDDEKEIRVMVDVLVEIDLVERVEAEEQFGAADGQLSVGLQCFFEEEFVVVVVLQCIPNEQCLQTQQDLFLLFLLQLCRVVLQLSIQLSLSQGGLVDCSGLFLAACGQTSNCDFLLLDCAFQVVDCLFLLLSMMSLLVELFLLVLEFFSKGCHLGLVRQLQLLIC